MPEVCCCDGGNGREEGSGLGDCFASSDARARAAVGAEASLRRTRGNTRCRQRRNRVAGLFPARTGKPGCFRRWATVLRGKPHPAGTFRVIERDAQTFVIGNAQTVLSLGET